MRSYLFPALLLGACLAVPSAAPAQEACSLSLTPPTFTPAANDTLHTLPMPEGRTAGHTAFHGQALYGVENLYLSHLPVFMGDPENHPHNFQVILAVDLDGPEAAAAFADERRDDPMSLYTATPTPFEQTGLIADYPGRGPIERLPGSGIFEGHFEQGGRPIMNDVTFEIERVVYFREFHLGGERLAAPSYVVFGRGGETFAAHLLSAPPDFDQMLAVEVTAADATALDDALAAGIYLTLPDRANDEGSRLQGGDTMSCSLTLEGEAAPITVEIEAVAEIYCEAGEFSALVVGPFNTARRCGGQ